MTLRDQSNSDRRWLPGDNFGMQLVALTFGYVCGYRQGWVRGFGAAINEVAGIWANALRRSFG